MSGAVTVGEGGVPATVRPGSLRAWVLASRPATLTAALVPVLVGTAAAHASGGARPGPALAALFGAFMIQIATNFANDVFDHEKGADTSERLGPTRAVQAGLLTPAQVRAGMIVTILLATLAGVYLASVGGVPIVFIGVLSVLSGIAFFGFVAVCGTAYVQIGHVPAIAWLASVPVGAIATAVLVVNNVRDRSTDVNAGKRTLAVRFGRAFGVAEYVVLLVAAYVAPVVALVALRLSPWVLLPIASLPIAVKLARTLAVTEGKALNACLTGTAKLLLLYGALFAAGIVAGAR
jgi:1,4-dihydroxy-2-naphthoate octaprenyltransferase